jgi:hypothetical protein
VPNASLIVASRATNARDARRRALDDVISRVASSVARGDASTMRTRTTNDAQRRIWRKEEFADIRAQ